MTEAMDMIRINQAAQGVIHFPDAVKWFSESNANEQRRLIGCVGLCALQAGARPVDVAAAATLAGVKPGVPASVLMAAGTPKVQLQKVLALPPAENTRTFSLLLALLSIADTRRRESMCKDGCSHWWHRDLRSASVVDDLVRSREAVPPMLI